MKNVVSVAAAIALTVGLGAPVTGQDPHAGAASPVRQAPLPVGTCVNLGNTLEADHEASWGGDKVAAEDLRAIAAAGFDTVRIPVRWHNKSQSQAPYTVDPAWMDRVQQIVDWALAEDLNVILNSHHFDPIHEDPLGVAQWHGGVWQQIARRFEGYPDDALWFELENEPHGKFDHSNLIATLTPALEAVRALHPSRPVIIGGENWSGLPSLATLPLPEDPNVHPTFHYYDPFAYTHQGASWTAPDIPPVGREFPTHQDAAQLARDVLAVQAYIDRTGRTPFMGETGVFDRHVPLEDRVLYHRTITDAFEPTGIGICVWGYANTFPFRDSATGEWLPGMLGALGLDEPDPAPGE